MLSTLPNNIFFLLRPWTFSSHILNSQKHVFEFFFDLHFSLLSKKKKNHKTSFLVPLEITISLTSDLSHQKEDLQSSALVSPYCMLLKLSHSWSFSSELSGASFNTFFIYHILTWKWDYRKFPVNSIVYRWISFYIPNYLQDECEERQWMEGEYFSSTILRGDIKILVYCRGSFSGFKVPLGKISSYQIFKILNVFSRYINWILHQFFLCFVYRGTLSTTKLDFLRNFTESSQTILGEQKETKNPAKCIPGHCVLDASKQSSP